MATNGDGRQIWNEHVVPARVDGARVVAHLALGQLLEDLAPPSQLGGFDVTVLDNQNTRRGGFGLCSGHVRLTHCRTGRTWERVYAAVRLGGLEVFGVSRRPDVRRCRSAIDVSSPSFGMNSHPST